MILACHQPNYLPWAGFFYKMAICDIFVLMDTCQFPLGRSFVCRNRIKAPPSQPIWITVPVKRKGRSLQKICDVQIENRVDWTNTHLGVLKHFYKRAPYFDDYIREIEHIYHKPRERLLDLNLEVIRFLRDILKIKKKMVMLSSLNVEGNGSHLLLNIAKKLGAGVYLSGHGGRKYLDEEIFKKEGIEVKYYNFKPPVYPQLWGDFLYNLSTVDLILNCGERAREII